MEPEKKGYRRGCRIWGGRVRSTTGRVLLTRHPTCQREVVSSSPAEYFSETAQITEFREGRKLTVGGAKPKSGVEVIVSELL